MLNSEPSVTFVGSLPPPLHGQSNVNKRVLTELDGNSNLRIIDLSPGAHGRSVRNTATRCFKALKGLVTFATNTRPATTVYMSVDAGFGLLFNIAFGTLARLKRQSLVLHHHSFSYINSHSRLMRVFLDVIGPNATHIFLCNTMRVAFERKYGGSIKSLVCTNAVFSNYHGRRRVRPANGIESMRIGLLSNLTADKGFHDFLALIRRARAENVPIQGVLAGPAVDADITSNLKAAQEELGSQLDYRGFVSGPEKDRFFDDIDVFFFPSHYRVESYPLVLIEALSSGVPVISFDRGCICEFVERSAGIVVPIDSDIVTTALIAIRRWLASPESHALASTSARESSMRLAKESTEQLNSLVETLRAPGRSPPS